MNCANTKISLDFEKLGSKLFVFLKDNKIENSIISSNNNSLTNLQLEKFLHGVQLKSYNFGIYKTITSSKDLTFNLKVVGNNFKKTNLIRNKLNALLEDFSTEIQF